MKAWQWASNTRTMKLKTLNGNQPLFILWLTPVCHIKKSSVKKVLGPSPHQIFWLVIVGKSLDQKILKTASLNTFDHYFFKETKFLNVFRCISFAVCYAPSLFSTHHYTIFQVSARSPHWSAAQPNTRLCLFNNRAQPSVNCYRRPVLPKHDSDRHTDLNWHFMELQQLPFTNPCPLQLLSCQS